MLYNQSLLLIHFNYNSKTLAFSVPAELEETLGKHIGVDEKLISSQSKKEMRASLVVQWKRILLPVQGTRVQSLLQEDPICGRATNSVHFNY